VQITRIPLKAEKSKSRMNKEDDMTNRKISDKAIEIVARFEQKDGRTVQKPKEKKCGYDLKSGKRKIEVKGTEKANAFQGFIISSEEERNAFEKGGYIYRVTEIRKRKPKIYIFRKRDVELVHEPRWRVKKSKELPPEENC